MPSHPHQAELRIGISGWTYVPWRGTFYPPRLRQADELAYASRQVNSIEINGTFYSLGRPASFKAWHDAVPEDFLFAVKGPRFITHLKRLKDVEVPLANFYASGLLALGRKQGPFLWQFPPNFHFNRDKLAAFFDLLPRSTKEAEKLARRHDDKVRGRALLEASAQLPLRHAIEIRHESFKCEEFVELLREHRISLVIADTAGKWPLMEDLTADFTYVRLHGDEQIYVSGYTPKALDTWADKLRHWQRGRQPANAHLAAPHPKAAGGPHRDLFVYFDNDVKVRAPADAIALAQCLGLPAGDDRILAHPLPTSPASRKQRPGKRPKTEHARTSWPALRRRSAVAAK